MKRLIQSFKEHNIHAVTIWSDLRMTTHADAILAIDVKKTLFYVLYYLKKLVF